MADYNDKIKELEEELKKTPYNKRTQHHIGLVKAKIAALKERDVQRQKGKGKSEGYTVRKSGDATVIMLGFPSVGKSTLLNALTNAKSPVGAYDFTTLDVIPGDLEYKGAKIQILDVPGVVRGAASGRGRGKEVLSVLRSADLVMIIVDALNPVTHGVLLAEAYEANLRLNKKAPDVRITKTAYGGIRVGKTVTLPDLNDRTIKAILNEFKISNADILIRTKIDADELIDVIEKNKKYVPAITVLNKIDLLEKEELEKVKRLVKPNICISANKKTNIENLKESIFSSLTFIRIYCKEAGKKADLEVPLILMDGATIETMCRKLHKDFVEKFKFARVWGRSAKFPGQRLMLKHRLKDQDVVELHMI